MKKDSERFCYVAFNSDEPQATMMINEKLNELFGDSFYMISDTAGEYVYSVDKPVMPIPEVMSEFFGKLDKLFEDLSDMHPHFTQFETPEV